MYGLNIDPNNPKGNPDPQEMRELGVQMLRFTYHDRSSGNQLDPNRANFFRQRVQAYRSVGITSLIILTYDTYPNRPDPNSPDSAFNDYLQRFANRAGQIAQLLAPFRPAFQIWNEPDHPIQGGYAPTLRESVYARMQRMTYDAIKAVDRNLLVVTAGLATGNPGWLNTVVGQLGGNLPADAVAFHPYGQRPDPDFPRPDWGFGFFDSLLQGYYRAGRGKPIWITEMGVKEEDLNNNREQVAEFLLRYYNAIRTRHRNTIEQFVWFCYSDGMVPTFGLADQNGNRKPSYFAYKKVASVPPPTPTPTPPPTPTPQPPPVPTPPTPSPDAITRLANQMAAVQTQVTQLQAQVQQLTTQQNQLRVIVEALQPSPIPAPPPTGVPQPAIQNVVFQLRRSPTKQFPARPLSQLEHIIIHHTAVSPAFGAERIAAYRVDKQGWPGIGYHYFITSEGKIQQTNELTTAATHAGQFDPVAVGVCFAGDFSQTVPTGPQLENGAQLLAWLLLELGLPFDAIVGYKELASTQSPGLQWDTGAKWGERLRSRIQAFLR